ncbi:DUF3667 domain-containing protein [Pedobacter xixiisoli]|uniref:DUF3667 domain-containing protein n=1 Tax=Pedobacter xixiisoli TaxID=1476464 RepID=A0A285ZT96_9SPHI|nr:DUF3667 domain-containing protein [Pedobacter xixiisoli]SOD12884.1 Protein of unknown function [Pedobacter xixiisoli]
MSSVKLRKEKDCLNCGHHVEETYCPHCGQENIELKEDALHMISHAIADYFHFEHKFFGTIKPLLFKPGKLTVDYVAGKRASFLHPIKLYIFISIVFFIVIFSGNKKKEQSAEAAAEITEKIKNDTLTSNSLKEAKQILDYIPISKNKKDSILKEVEKDINENGTSAVHIETSKKKKKKYSKIIADEKTVEEYDRKQRALPKAKRDNFIVNYFTKKSIEFNNYPDPMAKFGEDLIKYIPKMMFLLLPLFALILKLVYIRKHRFYYEHLIYSFHTHSAIFLSFILVRGLIWLTGFAVDISDWIEFAGLIYVTWYIYRSLRTFYGSTRWITLLKYFFLSFCYSMLLTLCFIVIIAISFIGG